MTLSRFDISENIKDWTDAFRTLSYRKHIHFTVSVEPSEEGYVMIADAEKMERITYNLLSNAFKFTPENGTIEIKLSQFTKEGERWLRYQVSDTGIGMPAEHVKHISKFLSDRCTSCGFGYRTGIGKGVCRDAWRYNRCRQR